MISLVFLLLSLGSSASDKIDYNTAHLDRRLASMKAGDRITIDGRLEERVWELAPVATGFIQSEPQEGEPASEKTEVRILYDSENLYIGVYAHDTHADNVVISDLKKDFNSGDGDSVEII